MSNTKSNYSSPVGLKYLPWFLGILCQLVVLSTNAQLSAFDEETYTSINPKAGEGQDINMPRLNYQSVFQLKEPTGGIIANVGLEGRVKLSVYNYDRTQDGGKGKLIYQIYSDQTSSDYVAKTFNLNYEVLNFNFDDPVVLTTHSDDIKKLAQEAKVYAPSECKTKAKSTWLQTVVSWWYGEQDACQEYFQPTQPVIIEVMIKNATLKKFKIPGMGEFDAKVFFDYMNKIKALSSDTRTRFAYIGDSGLAGDGIRQVSDMVKGWDPGFIISIGDVNYEDVNGRSIDENFGQYYHKYMHPYPGKYGTGSPDGMNRIFPVPGNHDYNPVEGKPADYSINVYTEFFNLPGNERYYDFVKGDVHFFAMNLNPHEPDGRDKNSVQAQWLKGKLAASKSKYKIVYGHYPPYVSCNEGDRHCSIVEVQWPFKEWGADIYLSGDSHFYERNVVDDFTYIVNGCGGGILDQHTNQFLPQTQKHYNEHGAMLVTVDDKELIFEFYGVDYELVDKFTIPAKTSRTNRSLAFEKETSQSSYYSELEGHSSLAVDGNIGGVFSDGSVTHTASESQPWWEVDLEEITRIDTVLLHNRTDCCSERLGNYHVLISSQPFGQASLEELKTRPGVHEYHQPSISGTIETFVPEVWGRYVRVQLAGTEALSLAEVEVHGSPLPEPLGHWKLDDEVLNSGSTSAALPSGAIPQGGVFFDGVNYREGWGSLTFDGSGYAELSPLNGDSFLHDGFADRSVSLWVRVEEATTQTIYDEGGTSNGLAIRYHANGTIEVATRNNGTQFTLPGYPIERGLWYHVAATYGAGGRLRLYIDGHQVSEGFAPYTTVNASSDNAAIGATVSEDAFGNVGTGQYLTGQIDDVRVFDSELGIGDLGWYRYPKASFKSLGSYSPGELITFTDASTNNPTSWQWTFEGGSPSVSTDQHPVVSFGAPGSYAVTLQVGNAQGISEPVRGHVNVTDLGSDHYYRLVNTATGKTLEVEGWSRNDGGNIRQWDYVGGTNQLFVLEKDLNSPTDGVTIRPAHTLPLGKVLEAGVGGPGTGAIAWHDNFTNHQRWHIVPRGLGLGNDFYIINDHTNLVLSVQDGSTANGAEVIVSNLDAHNDAHHWRFEPVAPLDANVQPLVMYELEAAHSGLLFDLYHGATADGTPIHQWPRNGTNAQKWYFQQLNRIEWELYSVHTNKLVEKGGGDESGAGAGINQWTPLDVQRQRWIMMELGNELYGLVNAQRPDLCAVVQGGSLSEGANIELQPCRLEDATHQWRLKPEAGVVYSVARQQSEEEEVSEIDSESLYEGLNVYPNPTANAVTVQFVMEESGTIELSITDLLGRSVYSQTIAGHAGNQQITLDDLKAKGIPSGVYLLRVAHGNQVLESRLIMK